MAMTREERIIRHSKQGRTVTQIKTGEPGKHELQEGIPENRNVKGIGIAQYTLINGVIHRSPTENEITDLQSRLKILEN